MTKSIREAFAPAQSSGKPQIWLVRSDEDGYFAGICIASSEDEAKEIGWKQYEEVRPGDQKADYHKDSSELIAEPLGQEAWGADGNGNLEIDK